MGTKMAPAYANIFMGRLEGQPFRLISLKPFSWFRFIDDMDMKWAHGPENLEVFLQEANGFHPTIRLTAELSNEEHVFLDTKSRLVGNNFDVDLYTKPTDTHQYLLPSSCHPKHCRRNVPYSLALRIRRICSNPIHLSLGHRVIGPTSKTRLQHTINIHSDLESQVKKKR